MGITHMNDILRLGLSFAKFDAVLQQIVPAPAGGQPSRIRRACGRHREAAFAAVAIQSNIRELVLDCFASLAMT